MQPQDRREHGREATATYPNIMDGFVYPGSDIQPAIPGRLSAKYWLWQPVFLMAFALPGGVTALLIWHGLPAATRK